LVMGKCAPGERLQRRGPGLSAETRNSVTFGARAMCGAGEGATRTLRGDAAGAFLFWASQNNSGEICWEINPV
jgi:hypothetical protein